MLAFGREKRDWKGFLFRSEESRHILRMTRCSSRISSSIVSFSCFGGVWGLGWRSLQVDSEIDSSLQFRMIRPRLVDALGIQQMQLKLKSLPQLRPFKKELGLLSLEEPKNLIELEHVYLRSCFTERVDQQTEDSNKNIQNQLDKEDKQPSNCSQKEGKCKNKLESKISQMYSFCFSSKEPQKPSKVPQNYSLKQEIAFSAFMLQDSSASRQLRLEKIHQSLLQGREITQQSQDQALIPTSIIDDNTNKLNFFICSSQRFYSPEEQTSISMCSVDKNKLAEFQLVRQSSGWNFIRPVFKLYSRNKNKIVMSSKKISMYKFVFSADEGFAEDSRACLGRLTSNFLGNELVLERCQIQQLNNSFVPIATIKFLNHFSPGVPRKIQVEIKRQNKIHKFTNRAAKWDNTSKVYKLDLRSKARLASVKNFVLEGESEPGKDFVLFGKQSSDRYYLSACFPFSPFQAFAVAIANFNGAFICQ